MYRTWRRVVHEAADSVLQADTDARDAAQHVFVRLCESGDWRGIEDPERFFFEGGSVGSAISTYTAAVASRVSIIMDAEGPAAAACITPLAGAVAEDPSRIVASLPLDRFQVAALLTAADGEL